jgi:precorrin-2 dehydrogenase / sirohydrochlorin ferrochelatase
MISSDPPRFAYPLMLDVSCRPCLVVGGGAVAERKVEGLVEAGARVTVVSPALTERLLRLATEAQLRWRPREYVAGDVAGFVLVMVATDDPAVNGAVAVECRERGILLNCADDPARCNFILPAVLRRGALTVTVSTGGASPTMARLVREELDALLPGDVAVLTDVMAEVRRTLRDEGISLHADRWREALDDELRRLAAAGRTDEARTRLLERLGV